MSGKGSWVFYFIQGQKGESIVHPNAFHVPKQLSEILLEDILAAFPFPSEQYHFRFQFQYGKKYVFLDLLNPKDSVPLYNGRVLLKVLRLDNLECATARETRLRQRGEVKRSISQLSRPEQVKRQSSSGSSRSTPVSSPPLHPSRAAPAPAPAAPPKEEELSPLPPDQVDEDLRDKSATVQRQIMARRNALRQRQDDLVSRLNAEEEANKKRGEERQRVKKAVQPRLLKWCQEATGKQKDIRALMGTMHTVLWEGIKLEPISMGKLIEPRGVRINYLKACRVLHPDKHDPNWTAEQKYIAEEVFHALETGYSEFSEKNNL